MDKIVLINKPAGWTSNDVVAKIKSVYKYKKVGHAGTLDPQATGLLIIGYDEGTKLLGQLILEDKEYEAIFQFGARTLTGDASSTIVEQKDSHLHISEVEKACKFFFDKYYQKPHAYSAVKIHGSKAYNLARKNIPFELAPKLVKINNLVINSFDEQRQELNLTLNVSKGFYVRSFVEDLAKKLNTFGYVKKLNRTKCGNFQLKNAYTLIDYLNKHET